MWVLLMSNAAAGLCTVTGFTLVVDQNESTGALKRRSALNRLSVFEFQPNEKPIGKEKESQIVAF